VYQEDDTAGFAPDWAERVLDSAGQLAAAQAVGSVEAVSATNSLLARLDRSNGLQRQHAASRKKREELTAARTDEAKARTAKRRCILRGTG
jgi:hypothetical protein